MHLFLAGLLVAIALLGFTASNAYACGCGDDINNINVENNTTNNTVNTNTSTNTNSNNSTAVSTSSANAQATSAAFAAATGGDAAAQGGTSSASTSVSVGGDDNPASSAAPVVLTTSNDTCMGSSGAGGQGMLFGFSVGSTWTDKNCVMLKNAREMQSQGYHRAARMRLCMDEDNAIAFAAAGDPCPSAMKTAQNAAAMMKDDKRMAALAPATDKSRASDAKGAAAAAKDSDSAAAAAAIPAGALAAFMLDSGNKILFDFDKSDLKPKARKTLDKQTAWLQEHEDVRVLIEGHADERGSREYNLALGERRANSAKRYLVGKGIAAERIDTVSYGKDRPAVAGSNEEAWSQNRRAVTQILPPNTKGKKVSQLPSIVDSKAPATAGFLTAMADVTDSPE